MIKRKEFTKLFKPYNESGTQIWVITRVKELSDVIVKMALKLADLDYIKYIKICDETLTASSDNYPKRPKVPIVHSVIHSATGIEMFYDLKLKALTFNDINPEEDGVGSEMVETILNLLPSSWHPSIIMYMNEDFWNKMEKKHNQFEWFRI